jgi:hypothetical protein
MSKNQEVRKIYVVEYNSVILGYYSNVLAAYNCVFFSTPEAIRNELPSYTTVYRWSKKGKDKLRVSLDIGNYFITLAPLQRFYGSGNKKVFNRG